MDGARDVESSDAVESLCGIRLAWIRALRVKGDMAHGNE